MCFGGWGLGLVPRTVVGKRREDSKQLLSVFCNLAPADPPRNRVAERCTTEDDLHSVQNEPFCGCCLDLLMAAVKERPEPYNVYKVPYICVPAAVPILAIYRHLVRLVKVTMIRVYHPSLTGSMEKNSAA